MLRVINIFYGMDIFNFLRGIAILCVAFRHMISVVRGTYPLIHYPQFYNMPAWIAVWMFFFLSGYLLGKGFYKGKYLCTFKGALNFYLTRLIRILPLYLFFLFIIFLFYNPMPFINEPKAVLRLLTFTYNGHPGLVMGVGAVWFVSVIFQLYILAPIVYRFVISKIKRHAFVALILIIIGGLLLRLLLGQVLKLDYYTYCYTMSLANLDLFFGAMLLNSLTMNSPDNTFKKVLRPISLILLAVIIILYIYSKINNFVYSYYCPTITLILMLLIIYAFDWTGKSKSKPLTFKSILINPLRFIEYMGVISFTFYLFHSVIIKISLQILKNPQFPYKVSDNYIYGSCFILMFVLTFILSVFVHYTLENPVNNLRKELPINNNKQER